jgi:hypothetical protein
MLDQLSVDKRMMDAYNECGRRWKSWKDRREEMTNYVGLYYPFIRFKDDAWLKLTALYWDQMARIVPNAYGQPHDSPTVEALAGDLGFIRNVKPGAEAVELGGQFLELLQQRGDELRKRYNVSLRGTWPDDPSTLAHAPTGREPTLAYVFYEKISPEVQNALESTGLAIPGRGPDPDWVGMHPKLAAVYMHALAETIAASWGFEPVTDETLDHIAVTGCTMERLAQALLDDVGPPPPVPGEKEIEGQMVRIALQLAVPENIADVPVKKIIKLRRDHLGELVSFQECVHKLATDLAKEEIEGKHLEEHLQLAVAKNIEPKLAELKADLKHAGIQSAVGALCISTSLPLATLVGLPGPVAAGAGIALGLTKVILDYQKASRSAAKSPVAYLLRLEKDLAPGHLLSWVMDASHRFFPGV